MPDIPAPPPRIAEALTAYLAEERALRLHEQNHYHSYGTTVETGAETTTITVHAEGDLIRKAASLTAMIAESLEKKGVEVALGIPTTEKSIKTHRDRHAARAGDGVDTHHLVERAQFTLIVSTPALEQAFPPERAPLPTTLTEDSPSLTPDKRERGQERGS
jgi:hypothetical protein